MPGDDTARVPADAIARMHAVDAIFHRFAERFGAHGDGCHVCPRARGRDDLCPAGRALYLAMVDEVRGEYPAER